MYILLDCADVDLCVFIKSGHLQKSVNPVVATWQLWNEMLQIVKVRVAQQQGSLVRWGLQLLHTLPPYSLLHLEYLLLTST